jgi:hypothetical protein
MNTNVILVPNATQDHYRQVESCDWTHWIHAAALSHASAAKSIAQIFTGPLGSRGLLGNKRLLTSP